jgi:hypothetical protein
MALSTALARPLQVRALNAYDFHKVGAGAWSHPNFRRGQPDQLKLIVRKKGAAGAAAASAIAPFEDGAGSACAGMTEDLRSMLSEERGRLRMLAQASWSGGRIMGGGRLEGNRGA